MSKTIWLCWFQGANSDTLSDLARLCMHRWKQFNEPEWNCVIVDNNNIIEYIPDWHEQVAAIPDRGLHEKARLAGLSDLVRVNLLCRYGGVYADVDVLPEQPLDSFYDSIVNETNVFMYRFDPRRCSPYGDRLSCSWFLCSKYSTNYLFEMLREKYYQKLIDKSIEKIKYFTFHETLCEMYDTDHVVKQIIDNMKQIDQSIPHSGCQHAGGWLDRQPSYVYKRPDIL